MRKVCENKTLSKPNSFLPATQKWILALFSCGLFTIGKKAKSGESISGMMQQQLRRFQSVISHTQPACTMPSAGVRNGLSALKSP